MILSKKHQRGLSLLEAGLGIALALVVMVAMTLQSQRAVNDMRAQAAADSLRDFNRFAMLYLSSHRDAILKASDTGEDAEKYCVLNADIATGVGDIAANTDKKTCSIDVAWLKHKKILPEHYPETNPYRQRWVAVYRNVFDDYNGDGVPVSQGDVELLVVGVGGNSDHKAPSHDELMVGASLLGGGGGFTPTSDVGACKGTDPAQRESCAVTGRWKVTISKFLDLE